MSSEEYKFKNSFGSDVNLSCSCGENDFSANTSPRFQVLPPIGRCFGDHRLFRLARNFVYRLDDRWFNRNHQNSDYQPTRHVLLLPYYAAWAAGTYLVVSTLFMGVKQDVVLEQLFFVVLPLLVLLNVFFSLKGIMSQLKCSKKILYSLFIAGVTAAFFCVVFYIVFWFFFIVCMILLLVFARVMLSSNPGTSDVEKPQHVYKEEVVVDDGSFLGKTLTKEPNGDWKDRTGGVYEEHDGFFKKKW